VWTLPKHGEAEMIKQEPKEAGVMNYPTLSEFEKRVVTHRTRSVSEREGFSWVEKLDFEMQLTDKMMRAKHRMIETNFDQIKAQQQPEIIQELRPCEDHLICSNEEVIEDFCVNNTSWFCFKCEGYRGEGL
jgi:hypothetical protein